MRSGLGVKISVQHRHRKPPRSWRAACGRWWCECRRRTPRRWRLPAPWPCIRGSLGCSIRGSQPRRDMRWRRYRGHAGRGSAGAVCPGAIPGRGREPGHPALYHHLDYNATTPVAPEVREVMRPWLEIEGCGNPSSDRGPGCHGHRARPGLGSGPFEPGRAHHRS